MKKPRKKLHDTLYQLMCDSYDEAVKIFDTDHYDAGLDAKVHKAFKEGKLVTFRIQPTYTYAKIEVTIAPTIITFVEKDELTGSREVIGMVPKIGYLAYYEVTGRNGTIIDSDRMVSLKEPEIAIWLERMLFGVLCSYFLASKRYPEYSQQVFKRELNREWIDKYRKGEVSVSPAPKIKYVSIPTPNANESAC